MNTISANNKIGYIDTSGEYVIEPKYDGASIFFDDGFAIVENKGADYESVYSIIDIDGNILFNNFSDYQILYGDEKWLSYDHNCKYINS